MIYITSKLMRTIKTIREEDTGSNNEVTAAYKERVAARAVVFDDAGQVALLHASKKHFHKLPGGGVEAGESIEAALERELLEEIGCAVTNVRELGIVEEFRNKFNLRQLSHCFLADLAGSKGSPDLEEDEIADGFETVWLDLDEAIGILEKETDIEDYEGRFIRIRDLFILKEVKARLYEK